MKKLIFIFAVVFVGFMSCKQSSNFSEDQGEYGTVVFDLTGGSNLRSVDDPLIGLPNLADSEMKILVESNGKRVQTVEFSKEKAKQYRGTFLIGTKIKFTAIVMVKSGKWKGSSEITVASGTNNLSVKLKKAIAELEPLKFKLYTDETISSNHVRRFSLGFFDDDDKASPFFTEGGKDIEVSSSEYKEKIPSFCRDSKGRTYIFYKNNATGGDSKIILKRYTSEGEEDSSFSYSDDGSDKTNILVAADNKTGNVFVSYKEGTPPQTKLFVIHQEGTTVSPKNITPIGEIKDVSTMSVYNNVISTVESDSTTNKININIYSYSNENTPVSKLKDKEIEGGKGGLLDINVKGTARVINGEVVDSFMNDKHIYFLYNYNKADIYSISTGGILKCGYSYTSGVGSINEVKRLIAKTGYIADEHNIINVKDEDEAKEFYGPTRFVGFNEDTLYIADDGTVSEYEAGKVQVLENKNRLVSFNLKSENISIENDKPNFETWLPENKAIAKTTPTLFFSYKKEGANTSAEIKLYEGNNFFDIKKSDGRTDKTLIVTNPTASLVYTFDSSGSFYVLHMKKTGIDTFYLVEKYSPCKTQNGIVYEYDNDFSREWQSSTAYNPSNSVDELYYDNLKKDLYCKVSAGGNDDLYRLEKGRWERIDKGSHGFQEFMTIYDGKIWFYNPSGEKVESIGIKDNRELELTTTDEIATLSDLNSKKVLSFSMYNDVLYFLYSNAGINFRQDVYALAVGKNGSNLQKTNEPLFKLAMDIKDIRPIGFDEKTKKLKFFYEKIEKDYDGRTLSDMDKYISLIYNENEGLIKEENKNPSDDIKWYVEGKVWNGAKDIILWRLYTNNETEYFIVSENELNPTDPKLYGNGVYFVYDKFCYDQFGNLYVLTKKDSDYYVVRFKLSEEGKYNLKELDANIGDFDNWKAKFKVGSHSFKIDDFIMAVYADTPNSGKLYYRMFDNPSQIDIKEHDFTDDDFETGSDNAWMSVPIDGTPTSTAANPNPMPIERQCMAMTANKDGVFIAIKELEYPSGPNNKYYKTYNIEVRKYPSEGADFKTPSGRIDIVGKAGSLNDNNEVVQSWNRVPTNMFDNYTVGGSNSGLKGANAKWDQYTKEDITDMYAYNGILYALSYKRVGGMDIRTEDSAEGVFNTAVVKGAIWKVGNTNEFSGNAISIHSSENLTADLSAKFATCHIIGILPKKIAIASDGYHGYAIAEGEHKDKRQGDNYDGVYFLNPELGSLESPAPKETTAKFNFQIKHYKDSELHQTTSSFVWE